MKNQKIKLNLPKLSGKRPGDSASDRSPWSGMALVKKLLLAAASVLIAMMLWGYVLMAQNPDRTKTYYDIPVKLESGSEADLLYKNLMVYGDIADILNNVNVTVSAPLTDITKITAKDISATVSFNDIHGDGVTRLEVHAVCGNNGTVVDISPAYIEVDVDRITTRTISVDQVFSGEMPEGYWHGAISISPKTVTVKGARRDIERISSAVCDVDLNGLTETVNHSFNLKLADEDGNEFDQSRLIESIPSVNVQMAVLPYKQVNIDYEIENALPSGLSIADASLNIESLTIAADEKTLSELSSITTETVRVDKDAPGVYEYTLSLNGLPEDSVIIDRPTVRSVKLTVVVEDTVIDRTFSGVTITVAGADTQYKYTYRIYDDNGNLGNPLVRLVSHIRISGDISIVESMTSGDFLLMIDVTGLAPGEHDVPVRLAWNETLNLLNSIDYVTLVHVTVEQGSQQ